MILIEILRSQAYLSDEKNKINICEDKRQVMSNNILFSMHDCQDEITKSNTNYKKATTITALKLNERRRKEFVHKLRCN